MSLNQGYAYREVFSGLPGPSVLEHLSAKYPRASEAEWAARLDRGEVELDGARASGREVLRRGQEVCWHRPPWDEPEAPLHFEVMFEDAHLLAVAKPSGLPTVPSGGFLKHTLMTLVQARFPEAAPLHRLGRGTSGLVLFSRTREAASRLSGGWREVEKRYRALAVGRAAEDVYEIDAAIGLVPHPLLGSVHGANPGGKSAQSTARVLRREGEQTLFEVQIHTGRSEQIRIHLAVIGHPLVGDPMFAAGGLPRAVDPGLPGAGGYFLHAASVVFTHPVSGVRMRLEAPPPPELA